MSERKEAGVTATVEGEARIGLVALCDAAEVTPDTPVRVVVRDVARPARVSPMPFVPTRYYRAP